MVAARGAKEKTRSVAAAMDVRVDVQGNRVRSGSRCVMGTHRWEALWIGCLVQGRGEPVSAVQVATSFHGHGQKTPLNRTGLRRVVLGTETMLDGLLGAGAFSKRVSFAPRTLTVGPWCFRALGDEGWQIEGSQELISPAAAQQLSGSSQSFTPGRASVVKPWQICSVVNSDEFDAMFEPLEYVFRADAMALAGQLQESVKLLRQTLSLPALSAEMRCVVKLRLARVLKRCGEYDDALELTRQVAGSTSLPDFRDPGLKALALHLNRRISYDREPNRFLSLGVDPFPTSLFALPDLRGLCEAENLAALVARRKALEASREGDLASGRGHLHASWALCQSALYWATSLRDHENAENVVFNAGLVLASMHELQVLPSLVPAVKAYTLGLLLRDNFDLGQDSVWDHIFIGNLWFEHPEQRNDFEDALGLERTKLSEPQFYLDSLRHAEKIGEERQIALCCVNVWRIADQLNGFAGADALKKGAFKRLRELLRGRSDLEATLRADAGPLLKRILGEMPDS